MFENLKTFDFVGWCDVMYWKIIFLGGGISNMVAIAHFWGPIHPRYELRGPGAKLFRSVAT